MRLTAEFRRQWNDIYKVLKDYINQEFYIKENYPSKTRDRDIPR